ncbi:LytTR family DNA-binding domain-containing protein [Rhodovibrionaceae bacterium A322]
MPESIKQLLRGTLTTEDLLARLQPGKLLVLSFIGGALAVAIEPDHTANLPLVTSFGLWASHIFLIAGLLLLLLRLLNRLHYPPLVTLAAAFLPLPLFFAPLSLFLDYGLGIPDDELTSSLNLLQILISETLAVAPLTYAVAALFVFLGVQLGRSSQEERQSLEPVRSGQDRVQAEAVLDPRPLLQEMIPSIPRKLGQDIIRLHAQDHYVEITTSQGKALLSEQFGSCVEKLLPLPGLQCHRSHWIALSHIESFSRSGSAYLCRLSNGDQVPVSRRRYQLIKEKLND